MLKCKCNGEFLWQFSFDDHFQDYRLSFPVFFSPANTFSPKLLRSLEAENQMFCDILHIFSLKCLQTIAALILFRKLLPRSSQLTRLYFISGNVRLLRLFILSPPGWIHGIRTCRNSQALWLKISSLTTLMREESKTVSGTS